MNIKHTNSKGDSLPPNINKWNGMKSEITPGNNILNLYQTYYHE